MMTHLAPMRARRAILLIAMMALPLGVPMTVLGHAELDTSDPAAGSTVEAPFAGPIVMTFTEALAKESAADLVGSSGKLPGTTAVDGSTMTLTPDAALGEGDYQVQWTSVADDGDHPGRHGQAPGPGHRKGVAVGPHRPVGAELGLQDDVTRVGARCEIMFGPAPPPATASAASAGLPITSP